MTAAMRPDKCCAASERALQVESARTTCENTFAENFAKSKQMHARKQVCGNEFATTSLLKNTALYLSHLCTDNVPKQASTYTFSPTKSKINLVATLIHRALFICSSSRLQIELDKIRSILVANAYLIYIITSSFTKNIRQFNQSFQH